MKTLCIYHNNCADGFAAAWVVRKFFKLGVDFHAADYNTEPPDVTGRNVIIVDFSYKKPVIEKMIEQCESILIIDHHKSAISELGFLQPVSKSVFDYFRDKNKAQVLFDTDKSGCVLTWRFFFPNSECPQLLKHIQDRDLWKFEREGTKEIMSSVFSYPYDFETWDYLSRRDINELYSEGVALLRKQKKDIVNAVEQTMRVMSISGINVPVANVPKQMASDACNLMLKLGMSFAASYFDKPTGREFSLRSSENGLDVAKIAESYGGGGHKHAAGFTLPYSRIHEFDVDVVDWR